MVTPTNFIEADQSDVVDYEKRYQLNKLPSGKKSKKPLFGKILLLRGNSRLTILMSCTDCNSLFPSDHDFDLDTVATQLMESPARIDALPGLRLFTSNRRQRKPANRRSFVYPGKDSEYPEDSTPECSPAPKPKGKIIKKRAGQASLQSMIKV